MIYRTYLFLLFIALFLFSPVFSQDKLYRNDTIEIIENGKSLLLPWAGGINGGQFSEIDVNFDGINDLFIFEANNRQQTTGGRVIIYLKLKDKNGNFYYKYAPEYHSTFPTMNYFCTLRDFNGDGKMDIFTRNNITNGIKIYRNDSDPSQDLIRFTLFINEIHATANGLPGTYPFYPNINYDFVDKSSFEDIDGDGDIDLLVVDRSEQFIEYYKNVSPTKDTMIFELKNTCWGNSLVAGDSILLNTCNPYGNVFNPERVKPKTYYDRSFGGGKGNKDAGISVLAIDLNGDGVKDLLSGNLTSIRMAMNNGTVTNSNFNSVNYNYPPNKPVKDKESIVIPYYVDIDHDGVKDLVTSVIWDYYQDVDGLSFYKNTGTNSSPVFTFKTEEFLNDQMIDVGTRSYPKFFNYDGDSLMDIIIGNDYYFGKKVLSQQQVSKLAVYKNIGKPWEPKFELVTKDFMGISTMILDSANNKPTKALNPTFGDIDGDGDEDMLIGDYYGRIHYFENNAGPNKTVSYDPPVLNYQQIKVGINTYNPFTGYASPQLVDLNRDGLLDLIVGEASGAINYFENTGTKTNPIFTLMNDTLGGVVVSEDWDAYDGGRSHPFFYQDSTGFFKLLCGSKVGTLFYYDSIEANGKVNNEFYLADSSYQNIWNGNYSSIHGADINGDTAYDFIVGTMSGGVVLYTSTGLKYIVGEEDKKIPTKISTSIFPNPANNFLNVKVDGLKSNSQFEIVVSDILGKSSSRNRIRNNDRVDISELPVGVYIVQLYHLNGEFISTSKVVIQR